MGKVLTLKRLLLEGLARPGENRLVCLNAHQIRVLSLLSDGRVQHGDIAYDDVEAFLRGSNVASSSSSSGTDDPWRVVRYRLPNGRSVCLGRLRQVGIEMDKVERELHSAMKGRGNVKNNNSNKRSTTKMAANTRRSQRQKKTSSNDD